MEKVKITKEKIADLVFNSYSIAKAHGFHDDYHSVRHYLMLALSEVGEMVEADRKSRRADVGMFKELEKVRIGSDDEYASYVNKCFVEHVKDTFEDEMADVVIRLCDFCGAMDVLPYMNDIMVDMSDEFRESFGDNSICEQCFVLCSLLTCIEEVSYDADDTEMRHRIGSALSFIFEMAHFHGIDLLWHVDRKMEYNESRPRRHGKAY